MNTVEKLKKSKTSLALTIFSVILFFLSFYSRLAITTKVTLDQVLGCIMWQSALMAINEPYRDAAVKLCKKVGKKFKKNEELLLRKKK